MCVLKWYYHKPLLKELPVNVCWFCSGSIYHVGKIRNDHLKHKHLNESRINRQGYLVLYPFLTVSFTIFRVKIWTSKLLILLLFNGSWKTVFRRIPASYLHTYLLCVTFRGNLKKYIFKKKKITPLDVFPFNPFVTGNMINIIWLFWQEFTTTIL